MKQKPSETSLFQLSIITFWMMFWFLNVVDKIIPGETFLWKGKDRYAQFLAYFESIGLTDPSFAIIVLVLTTIIEVLAAGLFIAAFVKYMHNKKTAAYHLLTKGILVSMFTFFFFTLGDQVFGDRVELLEHSTYWGILLVSWGAYKFLALADEQV